LSNLYSWLKDKHSTKKNQDRSKPNPEKPMIFIKYICQETDQTIQTSVPYSFSDAQIEALYPGYWRV
jgi:hypothetical protein